MRASNIILKKRNGESLTKKEIDFMVNGYAIGEIPDYQKSAFLMTIFFNGLSTEELVCFTESMIYSGSVIDFSEFEFSPVDKHSTGGVGDKTSIPLVPIVSSCGAFIPMISGRSLGHTGGTLDKLESIPGFNVNLNIENFKKQVLSIGCAIAGQTQEIVPADKKIYSLRDVTSTVDCIPLIASSIISKKLSEGIKGLVLDVKHGSGAFMQKKEDAFDLAKTMVDLGACMGLKTTAILTSMDQPLGNMIGTALEIRESLDILMGRGPSDVVELILELGSEMLILSGIDVDLLEAKNRIRNSIKNGSALEKFICMVEAQGGDPRIVDNFDLLPVSEVRFDIVTKKSGYLKRIDVTSIGNYVKNIGGGRERLSDKIDFRVGIEIKAKVGDFVKIGDCLCIVYAVSKNTKSSLENFLAFFEISDEEVRPSVLLGEKIAYQI